MELVTLIERWGIKNATSSGIITLLYDTYNPLSDPPEIPFIPTESMSKRLNAYYYFGWSGDKYSSPLVEKYHLSHAMGQEWETEVAKTFWEIHGDELVRQWELFQKEFDPLASYDVHEETGYEHEGGGSLTKTGKDTRTKKGKITTTDSIWGINSSSNVNSDKSEVDYGTLGVTDELGYASGNTTTDTASDELTVHKYGNLGTTSLTKLLKDDIEMWQWDFYTRFFFPAIDSMIALPIY